MPGRATKRHGKSEPITNPGLAKSAERAFESSGGRAFAAKRGGRAARRLRGDRRNAIRHAALATILVVAWCQAALGEEAEPALEETVAYMNAKLALCPAGFAQSVTLDERKSIVTTGHSVGQPGRYQTRTTKTVDFVTGRRVPSTDNRHRVRISLADLRLNVGVADLEEDRPHQIEDEPYDITVVSVQCAEVGCVEVLQSTQQAESPHWAERFLYPGETATAYHFFVCDDDEADRFQKALTHALELGGARRELF